MTGGLVRETDGNRQSAPFPYALAELVRAIELPGRRWAFELGDVVRDQSVMGRGEASGLTLSILVTAPDAYHPDKLTRTLFYFPVPPATYDGRSWRRWLFERCRDVDLHELCEAFMIGAARPYAPSHGPGNDPYMVREIGTADDAAWRWNQARPADLMDETARATYAPGSPTVDAVYEVIRQHRLDGDDSDLTLAEAVAGLNAEIAGAIWTEVAPPGSPVAPSTPPLGDRAQNVARIAGQDPGAGRA